MNMLIVSQYSDFGVVSEDKVEAAKSFHGEYDTQLFTVGHNIDHGMRLDIESASWMHAS